MNPEKEKKLEQSFERLIAISTNQVPMDGLEDLVDERIMGYGTTLDEEIFSLKEYFQLIKGQEEQAKSAGLDFNFKRKLVHRRYSEDGNVAIIVELLAATLITEEITHQFTFRYSGIMEFNNDQWKLVHWHGSLPSDTENDPWHINKFKREKEELEKLVAEQTLDLQQKNRELEIEASTERIRSAAMAMDKPEDIRKVLGHMKEEIDSFEMGNISTWMFTFTEEGKVVHREIADYHLDGELNDNYAVFDPQKYSATRKIADKRGEDFFEFQFKDDSLIKYLDSVTELDPEQTKNFRKAIESGHITEFWQLCSSFSKGIIGISFIETPPENAKQILLKITEAYGMAYKRFEDLQQAERRRKEAELEAAVERVRAHAMGMQKPDDIMNVLKVIKDEVESFELDNIATWIWTEDEDGLMTQWDISEVIEKGNLVNFNLRFDISKNPEVGRHKVEWQKGKKYYALNWKGKKLQTLIDEVKALDAQSGGLFQKAVDSGQISDYWQAASRFSKGLVGLDFSSEPPAQTEQILKKLASAFDMAYQRFEDLQKSEKQANLIREERDRLEQALKDLNATQDQLIQQEKLASLGELTAGIAHEIKNPLNFVNNFSEVSQELLDEMMEEIEKGDLKESKAILMDVRENLTKILHHGKRADSIVKGMLQHSRANSGEKELTDINVLTEEYLNLAYHGLRAMDKSFNSKLTKAMDSKIPEIEMVPQEIGRVILNLVNNAFYAVNDKKKKSEKAFSPEVKVATKLHNGKIEIAVEDNGNGIPEHVLDKIFQPFFTTKPTGQGTGLGLSMSNDIIKAHGGELKAHTEVGKGTIFSIFLPV